MTLRTEHNIAPASPEDIPHLPSIELAAATLLIGFAPSSVLIETTSNAEFEEAQRLGLLWVARKEGSPVGFAQVQLLEPGQAHLKEVDVHPAHGRCGFGTQLVKEVCAWARAESYKAVTLTTFRDVPFNMPFYAKLGFEVLSVEELSIGLLLVIADESRRGLDPHRRVAMRTHLVDHQNRIRAAAVRGIR